MKLREEFVLEALEPGVNFSALCRRYEVSRKTGYKWKLQYENEGLVGLQNRSRRPHCSPLRVSAEVTIKVLELRDAHRRWGPKTLHEVLSRTVSASELPSERTIARVLERAGRIAPRKRRCDRRDEPVVRQEVAVEGPNDLWTVDFKGWWRTKDDRRFEPLTVRDAFSRFLIGCQSLGSTKALPVRAAFERFFEKYGLPGAILVDNGSPFISSHSLSGLTTLSAWWVSLGIRLVRTRPAKPQDNGGHERMHRTMAEDVEAFPASTNFEQQKQLDTWRHEFNHVRPHRALEMKTPATLYRPSTRPYHPDLVLSYDDALCVRKVSSSGTFKLHGEVHFLSHALRGQLVGLRRHGHESCEVWFADHYLGLVSPGRRKVDPLEHPV